ncbi:class I SAM-dependent methyltransferase [Bradyrhizobium sp. CCBAU 51627]|uniref:class I SAM-dependent methyltransferase n=1 Tax=Bradyrhizobium sp. CCBAU 51627 TaxID=1325088 RepID=UPI0023063289|nr:class I SAM-dependent methyltransferase [Bradyrhizobium sp. CCBAU 51627]MDA9436239.1 phospholipid methyltransferase [Bradyrhizobium sp. CCBAU 51627]
MGFYNDVILPRLCDLAMRNKDLLPYRERAIRAAQGRVLEIGIGSGRNLPFYGPAVKQVVGLEPATKLLEMARHAPHPETPIEFVEGSAEAIPIEGRSIDTVVTTWTMCSIPNVDRAMTEARRVLKPGGKLVFVEHGRAPEPRVQWWQDRLTPAWKRISGGCHLNRDIADLLSRNGFYAEEMRTGYMNGLKPMTFMYEGQASTR